MSQFFENVIFEYPSLKKWKSWKKDSSYRIRVLEKKSEDGIVKRFLDIREFIVKDAFSAMTESGICLNRQNIDKLIEILTAAKREFFIPEKE